MFTFRALVHSVMWSGMRTGIMGTHAAAHSLVYPLEWWLIVAVGAYQVWLQNEGRQTCFQFSYQALCLMRVGTCMLAKSWCEKNLGFNSHIRLLFPFPTFDPIWLPTALTGAHSHSIAPSLIDIHSHSSSLTFLPSIEVNSNSSNSSKGHFNSYRGGRNDLITF